ncbi:DUF2694 family protein [Mycolicibacterium sp. CBM1]
MTEADPQFDAAHPSGHILFRSCRGGYLHSVALAEPAMDADAQTLTEAILLTAEVSYLRALMEVRGEILAAGHTPSSDVPGEGDLELATKALQNHRLRPDNGA